MQDFNLADAKLIAVKDYLKLYRLPSGEGVVVNGNRNSMVEVNIDSILSRDGYWEPVE
jgi:hypothetical protein